MILDDLVGDPQAFPGAPDRYGGRTRLGRGQLGTKIISPSWGFHPEKDGDFTNIRLRFKREKWGCDHQQCWFNRTLMATWDFVFNLSGW